MSNLLLPFLALYRVTGFGFLLTFFTGLTLCTLPVPRGRRLPSASIGTALSDPLEVWWILVQTPDTSPPGSSPVLRSLLSDRWRTNLASTLGARMGVGVNFFLKISSTVLTLTFLMVAAASLLFLSASASSNFLASFLVLLSILLFSFAICSSLAFTKAPKSSPFHDTSPLQKSLSFSWSLLAISRDLGDMFPCSISELLEESLSCTATLFLLCVSDLLTRGRGQGTKPAGQTSQPDSGQTAKLDVGEAGILAERQDAKLIAGQAGKPVAGQAGKFLAVQVCEPVAV